MPTTEEPPLPKPEVMKAGSEGFKPGMYVGMPRWDYDSAPGVSNTMMQDWVRGKKKGRTRALLIGSALHVRMEGREKFDLTYVKVPNCDLTTKAGKDAVRIAEKETKRVAIREDEYNHVAAMFQAITCHPVGRAYVESKAEREVAIFGNIGSTNDKLLPEHPTLMKGIVDLLGHNIWDLKTTGCFTLDEFKNSVVGFGYDAQAALYRELVATVKKEYLPVKWLIVLKTPPHEVGVIDVSNYMMASGLRWINTVLNLYERS